MTPTPPDDPRIGEVEFDAPPPPGAEEVLDRGHRRGQRLGPAALALAAVALVVGVLIGRWSASDDGHSDAAPSNTTSGPTAPATAPGSVIIDQPSVVPAAVSLTGVTCFRQEDAELYLGAQVVNSSARPERLLRMRILLPMRGLRVVVSGLGRCDVGYPAAPVAGYRLAPHGRLWLAVIVRPLERCPQPYPVQLQLTFAAGASRVTTKLLAFPDLGRVHWSRCPHG